MLQTEDCDVLQLQSLLGIKGCKSQTLQAFLDVDKTIATEMVSNVRGRRRGVRLVISVCKHFGTKEQKFCTWQLKGIKDYWQWVWEFTLVCFSMWSVPLMVFLNPTHFCSVLVILPFVYARNFAFLLIFLTQSAIARVLQIRCIIILRFSYY
jgi:hypothetical protein